MTKFPKLFFISSLITGLVLTACVEQQVSPIPTVTIAKTVQVSSTPKPTNTNQVSLTPTATMPLVYAEIDKKNVSQLVLLHQWDVENVDSYRSANFWFSDSNQFIVPSYDGIQAFKVDDLTPIWFLKSLHSDFTIDEDDQVIINLKGLKIFDRQGVEIQTIRTNHFCDIDEPLSIYIVTIPGTNLVVTGQQDSYRDFGLNGVGYDKARLLIWDITKNSCSELIKQFDGFLPSLSVSDDGGYISYSVSIKATDSMPAKSTTRIYDLNLRKEKCELNGGYNARFTRQNQLIVEDAWDGTISLVTLADCTTKTKFNIGTGVRAFAITPSGELLAGITDAAIHIWDVQTGEKLRKIDLKGYTESIIGFSPDGHFLITAKEADSLAEKDKVMLWGIPGN